MTAPGACLFDLDGTLIDHFAAIYRTYFHTLTQLGLPPPTPGQVKAAVGGGLERAARKFLPAERFSEGMKIYQAYWDRTMLDDVVLMRGAAELLSGLHDRGIPAAVLTNKLGASSRRICEKLGVSRYLRANVGAGDTPWLKPRAELTAHLLGILGASAGGTLMVGDSPYDVETAQNGGMKAWCVTTGTHDAPALQAAGADRIFPGLPEIGRELGLPALPVTAPPSG